jgi:methylenetetrahydrofolate dehydrogenase (NADP+)/methenyltetrahydrofolate cyclohydrolase
VAQLGTPLERPQEATRPRTSEWGEERQDPDRELLSWLKAKTIVLIGKGDTAGKPLFDYLSEIGTRPQLIDSKTENPQELTKQADLIISSVGKPEIIKPDMLKQGVILIGVGISKDAAGKLHGDYEEDAIQTIASAYTPTPGGVGPVNVAMLLNNLVTATENQI